MGRKPRGPHSRCRTPDPQKSGKAVAWLVVFVLAFWQTASPTLCRESAPQVADAGPAVGLPPVPSETWTDSGVGGAALMASGPEPVPGQKPGPCERGMTEMRGTCWYKLEDLPPHCPRGSVEWAGRCWVPVNGGLKSPPVAGGG